MATVTIIGIGPGPLSWLTKEAEHELQRADKVFLRNCSYPVYEWLRDLGKKVVCFDRLYTSPWPAGGDIYEFMVSALLKEASLRGQAVYAIPGSPFVLESTTDLLRARGPAAGTEVRVIHGMSFLEPALSAISQDFDGGLQIVLPRTHVREGRFSNRLPLLVCQIEARSRTLDTPHVDLTMKWLLKTYPENHAVTLIWTDGLPAYETQSKVIALKDLAREYGGGKYFASLFVPSIELPVTR